MADINQEELQYVKSSWENAIPWFLTIASSLVLITIAYYLMDNVLWFRETAINDFTKENDKYLMHIYHLHISMIKRSVGLFSGFAMMFLGVAVAFYTVKKHTKIDIQSQNMTFGLVTASPGIVAMVIGAFLITHSISSKDHFESYADKPPLDMEKIMETTLKGD